MKNYDVVIIGAGPAGYVAAIRCVQLGMQVACVDKWVDKDSKPRLGGTCLNVGCIPSKALLESAHYFDFIHNEANEHGITVKEAVADIQQMLTRKNQIINELTGGIELLFKAKAITWYQGRGMLLPNLQIKVTPHESEGLVIGAKHVIIASGSIPTQLPVVPVDRKLVCDSEDALAWQTVPKRLGIIGAGVIALELGSVWRRLGSKVQLFYPPNDEFLSSADKTIAKRAEKIFADQGLELLPKRQLVKMKKTAKTVQLTVHNLEGKEETHTYDKILVAAGRVANTKGVVDSDVGLKINERGFIEVDELCQTNIPNIYAIGDCVRGAMLAHKGAEEGVVVAERINGQKPHLNYEAIPYIIYTFPEVAWVGMTEEQAKQQGIDYKIGTFNVQANGRAKSMGKKTLGLCKLIADKKTDRLLGMHLLSPQASELISVGVQAIETESSSEDLARTIFAHPTLSEVIHEAALAVDKRALHTVK